MAYGYIQRNPGYVNQALQASGSTYQVPQHQGRTAGDVGRQRGGGGVDLGSAIGLVRGLSGGSENSGGQQGGGMGIQANPYEDRTAADANNDEEDGGLLSSGIIGKVLGIIL